MCMMADQRKRQDLYLGAFDTYPRIHSTDARQKTHLMQTRHGQTEPETNGATPGNRMMSLGFRLSIPSSDAAPTPTFSYPSRFALLEPSGRLGGGLIQLQTGTFKDLIIGNSSSVCKNYEGTMKPYESSANLQNLLSFLGKWYFEIYW